INSREFANQQRLLDRVVVAERAERMDSAIHEAFKNNLPVRVVVCDGYRRKSPRFPAPASRLLDPIAWSITAYDSATGAAHLTRGSGHERFVDQFSLRDPVRAEVEQYVVSGKVYRRDQDVRRHCSDEGEWKMRILQSTRL